MNTEVIMAIIVTVIAAVNIAMVCMLERRASNKMKEPAETAYNLDPDFKDYVDKYINKHHLTLEKAFKHKIVELYLDYLKTKNE